MLVKILFQIVQCSGCLAVKSSVKLPCLHQSSSKNTDNFCFLATEDWWCVFLKILCITFCETVRSIKHLTLPRFYIILKTSAHKKCTYSFNIDYCICKLFILTHTLPLDVFELSFMKTFSFSKVVSIWFSNKASTETAKHEDNIYNYGKT